MRESGEVQSVNFDFLCKNAANLRLLTEQAFKIIFTIITLELLQGFRKVNMALKFRELFDGLKESTLYHVRMLLGRFPNLDLQQDLPFERECCQLLQHLTGATTA